MKFSRDQLSKLEGFFQTEAYPTADQKTLLAVDLTNKDQLVTNKDISGWFSSRRRKQVKS